MANKKNEFWTVSRIASRLGVDRHRVEYVIESRGIAPIGRAGIARVYSDVDVNRIVSEVQRIDTRREEVARGN